MLEAIHQRGIKTEIVTNGSVMTDTLRDTLLHLETEVHFGIDGATEGVFQSVRERHETCSYELGA
jgi:wyosine [tRNA(Phe)-imidazoG37] synthetase (radical SAM superfamily)